MGVAYLAELNGTWVVIKVVRSDLADSPTFRARLTRELEAMRRAVGPYTAAVLAAKVDADPAWFAMEFIPGMNLAQHVQAYGSSSGNQITALATSTLEALSHIHNVGIIHRDLKPSNIMMSPTGPRLIDFGVAGLQEGTHLTRTGSIVGSTGWLAPEQITGDPITAATDIHAWALCVVFAATGIPPFDAASSTAALYRVLEVTPEIPSTVPQPLRDLLAGALAKNPAHRPTLEQIRTAIVTGTSAGWASPAPPSAPAAPTPPKDSEPISRDRQRGSLRFTVFVGLLAMAATLGFLAFRGQLGSTNSTSVAPQVNPQNQPTELSPSDLPSVQVAPSDPSQLSTGGSVATSPPTVAPSPPAPIPRYAVKVEYAGKSIPDATFNETLTWSIDVCSPDKALLNKQLTSAIKLYAAKAGIYKRVTAKAKSQRGGRCGKNQVNITMPYRELAPANSTDQWSKCRNYRVTIPETPTYRSSAINLCVRIRLLPADQ